MKSSAAIPTSGILYIVATPIGHTADITSRAIQTLQQVDLILVEDSRHSRGLLNTLGISKPLISVHEHNELNKLDELITLLESGKNLALISDAGTPLICDPGFVLVRELMRKKFQVIPIPGACALIAALSASGIACDKFIFAGFLPAKQTARLAELHALNLHFCTTIVYESTHRIVACLEDIIAVNGEQYEFVLAKEITKIHERFIQATALGIKDWLLQTPAHTKGEFVLILPAQPKPTLKLDYEQILSVLLAELPLKQAVKLTHQITGTNKNSLYKTALILKEK